MKYQILTVGIKDDLLSLCREHFVNRTIELKKVLNISEAVSILRREPALLLVLDMEYLRSIGQSDWIINIRYVSYFPIIVLSDVPETDIVPSIQAGADICFDSKLPPSIIVLLLSAQLRRYTEYNHYCKTEATPFQAGDIAIDQARRLVWVRGKQIKLRPREFTMLLYFMRNPNIVLTSKQICKHAWGITDGYKQGISHPIRLLRESIEPDPSNPIYIKTIHHVGYCYVVNNDETCEM